MPVTLLPHQEIAYIKAIYQEADTERIRKKRELLCHTMPLSCQAPSAGGGLAGTLVQRRSAQPELGADVSPLTLNVENIDSTTLRVKLGAPGRWEVPRSLLRGTVSGALPCWSTWPWVFAAPVRLPVCSAEGEVCVAGGQLFQRSCFESGRAWRPRGACPLLHITVIRDPWSCVWEAWLDAPSEGWEVLT